MSRSVGRRIPSLVFGLIGALAAREGVAQRTPRLLVDVEPGGGSSSPTELAVAGGRVYFSACLPATGCEPWSSDGTAAGTMSLGDLRPGDQGSAPRLFVGVGAQVFFLAHDGTTGHELWVTDGTAAGTHLVEEIRPGAPGAQISEMVAFEDRLWFDADDGTNGTELWSSDGTADGTALAANLVPGGASSAPGDFTVAGGALYFAAAATGVGRELHRVLAGVVSLVADARPGATGSTPARLAPLGDGVFFVASDGVAGREPWVSDGTPGGTDLLLDVRAGSSASNPNFPIAVGDEVFFVADDGVVGDELWRTDGTPAGTGLVRDLVVGPGNGASDPRRIAWQGALYFLGTDGGADAGNGELWRSDGTESGTVLVRDLRPVGGSAPGEFAAGPDRLFFVADDGGGQVQPFVTDGTAAGTKKAAIPAGFDPAPRELVRLGDRILFSASDGSAHGRELWAFDHPFFADGFDLGGTSAWSSTAP